MTGSWFRLENFYEQDGSGCVFYPSLYSRGYRFSAENRAAMDAVLGPFLSRRLWIEFMVLLMLVTFVLTLAFAAYLLLASSEELDALLATPPWVLVAGAFVLAAAILAPIVVRLRLRIRRQLDGMGVEASEPPRPDFFIVDGKFSRQRLCYVFLILASIVVIASVIAQA